MPEVAADGGAWSRLPLRTRLTVVSTALLVVGLVLTGTTALGLLQRSLVEQADAQLDQWTPALVRDGMPRPRTSDGPTDYQVAFASVDGSRVTWWDGRAGRPVLPAMDAGSVAARGADGVMAPDEAGAGRWRLITRLVVDDRTGEPVGSVAVALPLAGSDATVRNLRLALVAITLVVATVGALAAWWGVRRSLRPLEDIEATAAAIAAGDLSRRVPAGPPATEVGHLAVSLNAMLGQLEAAFAERATAQTRMRRFVSDAGHELRTPLATIRGYAELHRMGAVRSDDEVADTMARIEGAAVRMGGLVDDLLALTRLDEGRPLRRQDLDLTALARDAAADLRALDPTREVRVVALTDEDAGPDGAPEPVGAPGPVGVHADEQRLRQVLVNLVGNAAQHTPRGTPVEIALGRRGDGAVLEVRDHGPGVPEEHRARVFERFHRVDEGRARSTGGSGLGLAIVAAIVAAHGGTAEMDETPGGGATARVTLPLLREGTETRGQRAAAETPGRVRSEGDAVPGAGRPWRGTTMGS